MKIFSSHNDILFVNTYSYLFTQMPLWECVHACSFRNFAESVIFRPRYANKNNTHVLLVAYNNIKFKLVKCMMKINNKCRVSFATNVETLKYLCSVNQLKLVSWGMEMSHINGLTIPTIKGLLSVTITLLLSPSILE